MVPTLKDIEVLEEATALDCGAAPPWLLSPAAHWGPPKCAGRSRNPQWSPAHSPGSFQDVKSKVQTPQ